MGQAFISGNSTVIDFPSTIVSSKSINGSYTQSVTISTSGTYIVCAAGGYATISGTLTAVQSVDLAYAVIENAKVVDSHNVGTKADIIVTVTSKSDSEATISIKPATSGGSNSAVEFNYIVIKLLD
jgi:hypothetical protein